MEASRPLAEDSTERDRQSQTSIIFRQRLYQRALGTALLAAWVLVAFGSWPDWREVPDFGGGGGKQEQHVLFTQRGWRPLAWPNMQVTLPEGDAPTTPSHRCQVDCRWGTGKGLTLASGADF
jgi:hypothetical protein